MNVDLGVSGVRWGVGAGVPGSAPVWIWADGLDGQEDELEDVQKGKLDPPTNDEGRGSIDESNRSGTGIESEDEDDSLVRGIEDGKIHGRDPGASDWDRSNEELDELARKAGVRQPE
jgi:hypothetical protein